MLTSIHDSQFTTWLTIVYAIEYFCYNVDVHLLEFSLVLSRIFCDAANSLQLLQIAVHVCNGVMS